jgi:pimeloyl-ACP methyl ester carboxylesterase
VGVPTSFTLFQLTIFSLRLRIPNDEGDEHGNPMSLFCLVHGSTQSASCWDLLVPALERHGHQTVCVVLPTDEIRANTNRYAEIILKSIPAPSDDVIVVGHSVSGYFLPVVAMQRPLRRMVFLAASLPQIGRSFLDQLQADPTLLLPDWIGMDPSKDDAAAMHFLFHDCSPEVAEWAMSLRIRLPLEGVAREVYPLQGWPNVPSSYIVCTKDRTISPAWSRRTAREQLDIEAIEIPSGHCPYLSRPRHLADVLARLARI